jgi:hypothetical protein
MDGLLPDLLLRAGDAHAAQAPPTRGRSRSGRRRFLHAITLPAHASMLTGVVHKRKHELEWNKELPLAQPRLPALPHYIFEVAHKAGYATAMAAGKSKFSALAKPGTVGLGIPSQFPLPARDDEVTRSVYCERANRVQRRARLCRSGFFGRFRGWPLGIVLLVSRWLHCSYLMEESMVVGAGVTRHQLNFSAFSARR